MENRSYSTEIFLLEFESEFKFESDTTVPIVPHLPVRVDLLNFANRELNLYEAFCMKFNGDFSSFTPAVKQRLLLPR